MKNKLKAFFTAIGKSQKEVAEELGVSPTYITLLFTRRQEFGKEITFKFQEKYGISAYWLMSGGEGEMIVAEHKNNNIHNIDIITDGSAKAGRDVNMQGSSNDMLELIKESQRQSAESQRQSAEVLRQTAQMQEIMRAMIDKMK